MALQATDELTAAGAVAGVGGVRSRAIPKLHLRKGDLALYVPLGLFLLMVVACFLGPTIFHLPPASYSNLLNANLPLFSPGHLIPLLIIAGLVFFGWKQLPDMARSAGRSLRIFRTEIKGLADDDAARETRNALTSPLSSDPVTPPVAPAAGSWASSPPPQTTDVPVSSGDVSAPDPLGKPAG